MMMMSVTDILEQTDQSCDFDFYAYSSSTEFWQDVIKSKAGDTGFGHLVDDYFENAWRKGSTICWLDGEITEGHHRLVMAILLCLDEVPVSSYSNSPEVFRTDSAGNRVPLYAHSGWGCDESPIQIDLH